MAAMLCDVVVRRRRRWAHAPVIHAASHFDHKKRVAWVPISMHTCGSFFYNYGAPLGGPSGRRSSAMIQLIENHSISDYCILQGFERVQLVDGCVSEWKSVPSGVPQGTKKGTRLFLSPPQVFLIVFLSAKSDWETGREQKGASGS